MATFYAHNRDSFKVLDRIIGASRHSIQLKGDNGEVIFCHNRVFGRIISDPSLSFHIVTVRAHEDPRTGRFFPETKWVEAFIPTRF